MAVLAEAISVVVRVDAIHRSYKGGWKTFEAKAPNKTLCSDNEITRVGFMAPGDVRRFTDALEQNGLTYLDAAKARDMVVVDQQRGPCVDCDWIEFGRIPLGAGETQLVAACRLKGSQSTTLMMPDEWTYEGSLSEQLVFVPTSELSKHLEYIETDEVGDVYLDKRTGKRVYAGRTYG